MAAATASPTVSVNHEVKSGVESAAKNSIVACSAVLATAVSASDRFQTSPFRCQGTDPRNPLGQRTRGQHHNVTQTTTQSNLQNLVPPTANHISSHLKT